MVGTPQVNSSDATGVPPVSSEDIPSRVAVIASAYQGTSAAKYRVQSGEILTDHAAGPLVRSSRHILASTRIPLITVKCDASNPGEYDTIDLTGMSGTCVPAVDASVVPRDEYEAYWKIKDGGTVGTAGITYYESNNGGRLLSGLKKLGTATAFALTTDGIKVDLDPPTAALAAYVDDLRLMTIAHFANIGNLDEVIALANDIKAKYNAHRILTAGSVHGAADSTNVTSAPNATNLATAITLLNELRTDYEAHRVLTSGSVHGAADSTNTISAPVASNLATAVTLANDLRTKYEAHRVLTAGTVHGGADSTNAAAVAAVTATHGGADSSSGSDIPGTTVSTLALARTCMIALKAAALLHVVLTAGSVHGAADTTAQTALTAISVSSSSTGQQVLTAALAYADAMFGDGSTTNDAHTLRTTSSIHGIEDTTDLITATTPTAGTLVAGDIIRVQTFAPSPSADDLAAAFSVLALSDYTPGIVLLPGRTPASLGPTITAGLDLLKANGKPCECIIQARRATDVESQADLRDALEDEWDDTDKRLFVCATDALCTLTEGSATLAVGKERFCGFASNYTVRRVVNPFYETTWRVQPALEGVRLVNDSGVVVGHDEPRDVETRLQLLYRVPDSQLGRPAVPSIDYALAGEEDREKTLRVNLIRDEIERVINSWAWGEVGVLASVTVLTPTSGRLNEGKRQDMQRNAAAKLASRPGLASGVSDIEATDLVVIDPLVTLNGDIITIRPVVNWTPVGAIGRVDSTISARVGS